MIDGARRGAGRRRLAVRGAAARRRRPLRPVVEGVHAGDGEGGLRRDRRRPTPKRHFTVGIVDDVTHTVAAVGSVVPDRGGGRVGVGVLRPRRRRHRRRQQELDQDHRRGDRPLRAGLLRLRLEEVGRDHDLAPALEPAADPLGVPGRPRRLRRLPPVRVRRQDRRARARGAGRGVPAERAVRRRRGLGPACRARCRSRSSRRRSASSPSTPTSWRKRAGMGTRINTIMQTCFFAISGVLPRDEAIAHIKKAIEKTYGKRGPEVVRRNCEVVDQALAHLHEIPVPAAVERHAHAAAARLRAGARLRAEGHRGDAGRQGRPAAGERVSGRRHLAGRRRRSGRSGTSRSRSRSGTRRSASSATSARWSARTRRSAPRSTTTSALAGAPPTFKSTPYKGNEYKGKRFTIQVAPEDCTGCNLCVNVCPAKDRTNPKHKAIDMHPQAPLREPERANYDFFLDLPELDRTDDDASSITRARSSSSRCSSTPAPAPAAARRRTSSCSRSCSATGC